MTYKLQTECNSNWDTCIVSLLEDRGCITVLVPINRIKQNVFNFPNFCTNNTLFARVIKCTENEVKFEVCKWFAIIWRPIAADTWISNSHHRTTTCLKHWHYLTWRDRCCTAHRQQQPSVGRKPMGISGTGFCWPDTLQVIQATLSKHWRTQSNDPQPAAWSHPFFIHHPDSSHKGHRSLYAGFLIQVPNKQTTAEGQ